MRYSSVIKITTSSWHCEFPNSKGLSRFVDFNTTTGIKIYFDGRKRASVETKVLRTGSVSIFQVSHTEKFRVLHRSPSTVWVVDTEDGQLEDQERDDKMFRLVFEEYIVMVTGG